MHCVVLAIVHLYVDLDMHHICIVHSKCENQ